MLEVGSLLRHAGLWAPCNGERSRRISNQIRKPDHSKWPLYIRSLEVSRNLRKGEVFTNPKSPGELLGSHSSKGSVRKLRKLTKFFVLEMEICRIWWHRSSLALRRLKPRYSGNIVWVRNHSIQGTGLRNVYSWLVVFPEPFEKPAQIKIYPACSR